jgi:hypothetical protein
MTLWSAKIVRVHGLSRPESENTNSYVQAALVIRRGYVPRKYLEYQNCEY